MRWKLKLLAGEGQAAFQVAQGQVPVGRVGQALVQVIQLADGLRCIFQVGDFHQELVQDQLIQTPTGALDELVGVDVDDQVGWAGCIQVFGLHVLPDQKAQEVRLSHAADAQHQAGFASVDPGEDLQGFGGAKGEGKRGDGHRYGFQSSGGQGLDQFCSLSQMTEPRTRARWICSACLGLVGCQQQMKTASQSIPHKSSLKSVYWVTSFARFLSR